MYEYLSVVDYVPFDSDTIGNPALELGDVLRFCDGQADAERISAITAMTCRIGGKHSLKCVGKNPRLSQAKSKNDKNISGLLNEIEKGKMGIHNICVSPVTIKNRGTFILKENGVPIVSLDFKIKDYYKEEERIIKNIISKVTNNGMTPFEKMEAVTNYFINYPVKYYPNAGGYLYLLARLPIEPWWHCFRVDSYMTPIILYRAAEIIGGFDDIENGYFKYMGRPEWSFWHANVEVKIGNKTRSYSCCPSAFTGTIDLDNVEKINFKRLSKFVRIY